MNITERNFFTNKVHVSLHMFHALILNGVGRHVDSGKRTVELQ